MNVIRGFSTDKSQSITNPFRDRNGIFIEFRSGDFVHPDFWRPWSSGKWFEPPYFKSVTHFWLSIPLPFISWRFGNKAGYFGMKAYGVDADAYKNWMPAEWVYPGSVAIMFSVRPFARVDK